MNDKQQNDRRYVILNVAKDLSFLLVRFFTSFRMTGGISS